MFHYDDALFCFQFIPRLVHGIFYKLHDNQMFHNDDTLFCFQFIPSLVHAMFYLLREYQVSDGNDVLGVLRKGQWK